MPKKEPKASAPADPASTPEPVQPSFEQSMSRLGEIVEQLEQGEQPLEESLRLFEEGMRLARSSQQVLNRAEQRVEELLSVTDEGQPVVREMGED